MSKQDPRFMAVVIVGVALIYLVGIAVLFKGSVQVG